MALTAHASDTLLMGRLFELCGKDENVYKSCATSLFKLLSARTHNLHGDFMRSVGFPPDARVSAGDFSDAEFLQC